MNPKIKQAPWYTVLYIVVMVIVVGTALTFTSLGLKERQQANVNADKMRQILASAGITAPEGQIIECFEKHIISTPVYNIHGNVMSDNAFDIDAAVEAKRPKADRQLPVFVCRRDDGSLKYIIPLAGAGLWGPIWGYVAMDADGSTIFGAYFAHQGETPGLGAEISKPAFSNEFVGKELFKEDRFLPVNVLKKGLKPLKGEDYVDAISGGTITSKGVADMLDNCLAPYQEFLRGLSKQESQQN